MNNNLNLFVVGATGYIGRALLAAGKKLFNTIGTSTKDGNNFLQFRLEYPADFDYTKIRSGDIVILCAAVSAPDICAREYDRAWATNVIGTSQFIQAVIDRGARLIFFSSDTVYGEKANAFDERAKVNPAGEYAIMKREVEQRFLGNTLFKAVRLSYVFSREDKFSCYLAGCNERKEVAELFHPLFRAIVHRDDVVEGVLALAIQWNVVTEHVINFGGPQVLSRRDFAETLRSVIFHDLRFKITEPGIDFFKNRPRVITMTSPVFARLLRRPIHTLSVAARMEFTSSLNAEGYNG
jgi:dTDP-4-dehydrorhamnose reductase